MNLVYAAVMFLGSDGDRAVRNIWDMLADEGITSFMPDSGIRPHVTLAVYDKPDVPEFDSRLEEFASEIEPFDISMPGVGVFPGDLDAVFLAIVLTRRLLEIHARYHRVFEDLIPFETAHYLPENWVPHCTLAMDLPKESVPDAMRTCRRMPLPIRSRLVSVGIVECYPVVHLPEHALGSEALVLR
jgi:2'-5' RNA ligase